MVGFGLVRPLAATVPKRGAASDPPSLGALRCFGEQQPGGFPSDSKSERTRDLDAAKARSLGLVVWLLRCSLLK